MDRALIEDVRRRLAPEGGGGIADGPGPLDVTALAAIANEHGARFAHLDGPSSKRALLAGLAKALTLPAWTGRNWDALEEHLAHPESDHAGPLLIAWTRPDAPRPGRRRDVPLDRRRTQARSGWVRATAPSWSSPGPRS